MPVLFLLNLLFIGYFNKVSLETTALLILNLSIIVAVFLLKRKNHFLKKNINAASFIIGGIIIAALFAPLIAPFAPDESFNKGECRLLPPFAKKIILLQKENQIKDNFFEAVIGDSVKITDKVLLYKKGKIAEFEKDQFQFSGTEIKTKNVFFIIGTDEMGRDLYSEVIYGARLSLIVGISSAIVSFLIALFFSFISMFPYRIFDMVSNRISEMFLAAPSLFIIIFAISFFGNSLFSVILVLGITSWMSLYKILNVEIKRTINKNFIISSFKLGISKNKIFFNEIIPLILPSIIVNLIFQIANFIIVEASLSFLGLGPKFDYPSWGGILNSGISYLSNAWWLLLFPGTLLFLTIITLNAAGVKIERNLNPLLND